MFHLSFLLLFSLSSLAYKVFLSFLASVFFNVCVLVVGKEREKPSTPVFEALLWLWRQWMLENVSVGAAFPPLHPPLYGAFWP